MNKQTPEWETEYDPMYLGKLCAQSDLVERIYLVDDYVLKLLERAKSKTLQEVLEAMPKKEDISHLSRGGDNWVESWKFGFNKCLSKTRQAIELLKIKK